MVRTLTNVSRTRSTTHAKRFSEAYTHSSRRDPLTIFHRYAVAELQKDVEREIETLPEAEREAARTKFGIFVVHNKRKTKLGTIPDDVKCACFQSAPTL